MVQGRVGKGLLFFFGLYGLFFYGMSMGQWCNVYLRPVAPAHADLPTRLLTDIYHRPQFAGQFWIGAAAWPAIQQYWSYDRNPEVKAGRWFGKFQRAPDRDVENELQREHNKRWDLGWVYTVIAGMLNILVIYDAVAGPAFRDGITETKTKEEANSSTKEASAPS